MKVKEMIAKLERYNENAEFSIIVNGCTKPFEVCIGYSEGCTSENCKCVDLLIGDTGEVKNDSI